MNETKTLASYVVSNRWEDIPADVRHEAKRAIINVVGCAIGGSPHPAVTIAIRALSPFSGDRTASVIGRVERLDPLHASLMNGISSHVEDYDDTTPKNYSHTSSPVASALFAYASANRVRGRDFVEAFILGFEAASRVGNVVYPGALRRRLAHDRHDRRLRRGGGDWKTHRSQRTADDLGAWTGRARSPPGCARCSARWARRFIPGDRRRTATRRRCSRRPDSRPASAASKGPAVLRMSWPPRAICRRSRRGSAWTSTCARTPTSRFPAGSSTIRRSTAPSRFTTPPAGPGIDRRRAAACGAARARPVQPAEHHEGSAGQVLRVPRRGRRARARQGRLARVHRRSGERSSRSNAFAS